MEPGIIPIGLMLFRDAIEHGMEQYQLCAHPILQLLCEEGTPLNKAIPPSNIWLLAGYKYFHLCIYI